MININITKTAKYKQRITIVTIAVASFFFVPHKVLVLVCFVYLKKWSIISYYIIYYMVTKFIPKIYPFLLVIFLIRSYIYRIYLLKFILKFIKKIKKEGLDVFI